MDKFKCLGGAIGLVVWAGFNTPALAGPIPVDVSNVQVDWSQGEGLGTNVGNIYYAGPISFTLTGSSTPIIVWCDDFYNDVYIGSSDQYYMKDAKSYLSPLSVSTVKDIAGLAYEGTTDALKHTLSPAMGAEIQMAIWEIEYGDITATDAGVQAAVETLISGASANYSAMAAAGGTYAELVSPGCGQAPAAVTYTSECQVQGQIYIYPNSSAGPDIPVPEPGTLGLLGVGLFGFGGLRFRRKAKPHKSLTGD